MKRRHSLPPTILGTSLLVLWTIGLPGPVAAAPVETGQPMASGPACDPAAGLLTLQIDRFGSFGRGASDGADALFLPGDGRFGAEPRGTVFQKMPFLCMRRGAEASGRFLEASRVGDGVVARADGDQVSMRSTYTVDDVEIELEVRLDCTILSYCWTLTNRGPQLDELALIPYLDGDLFFVGAFENDFGGASQGEPRSVFEYDEGDDPMTPTSFLALIPAPESAALQTGWEVGEYRESRDRLERTQQGCEPLRGGLFDQDSLGTDADGDLFTDRGYDITLALRFDAGRMRTNQRSEPICYSIQWGVGLACSDEDGDGTCLRNDNCPEEANPEQFDRDEDGVGDLCDVCPDEGDPEQGDRDGDGVGDACDICPEVPNRFQRPGDRDGDGVPDACDNCPATPNPGQEDGDGDGIGDHCQSCVVPDSGVPNPEVCDGLDNDCDGVIDNDADTLEPCATDQVGACAAGVGRCVNGVIECLPANPPEAERCDFVDNDCDGRVDEGVRNPCNGCGVQPESCNGIDDDCDGEVDEDADADCEGDLVCAAGRCVEPCENLECPGGQVCVTDGCVAVCVIDPCQPGWVCDEATGACANPCTGVECPEGRVCADGRCLPDNCYAVGCPPGRLCREGACVVDPCRDVECGGGAFCREGRCVQGCGDRACTLLQDCLEGLCVDTGCEALCAEGEICDEGRCVADPCVGVGCLPRQICLGGFCEDDPCQGIECGLGESCLVVQGTAQCYRGVERPDGGDLGDAGARDGGDGGAPSDGGVRPDRGVVRDGSPRDGPASGETGPAGDSLPALDVPSARGDTGPRRQSTTGGCGCGFTGAQPPAFVLLLPLAGLLRRRRLRDRRETS